MCDKYFWSLDSFEVHMSVLSIASKISSKRQIFVALNWWILENSQKLLKV